jgi:hypothetical protein
MKFNSHRIAKAIEYIKSNSIIIYADKISADLIAIETFLDGLCPITFEWRTLDDFILSWKKTTYNKFRIHVAYKDENTSELLNKVLCETSLEIRIKTYPFLENFLFALNENNKKFYAQIMKDYEEIE